MPFAVKDWLNKPDRETPVNAAALEDMETRLSDYTDQETAAIYDALPFVLVNRDFPLIAPEADDSARLQRAIDSLTAGGTLAVTGDYAASGLTVAPNKPIRILGSGMALGGTNAGRPARIQRTSGTATLLSCVGTGQTSATRGRVAIENVALHGGSTAGLILDLQRCQNVYLHRLDIGFAGATGLRLRELYNSSGSDLYIHDCGNGAANPAMVMDAVNAAQGGSSTVHFTNVEFESNYGTDLKLTGDAGATGGRVTSDVTFTNVKMEGGRAAAAACPYIDLDFAQGIRFVNTQIVMHGDSDRTAVPVQQITTAGAVSNMFIGLIIDITQATAPTYLIQQAVGTMHLIGLDFPSAVAPGTAFIRIDAAVAASGSKVAHDLIRRGATTVPVISDARTFPTVASAATITLSESIDVHKISGTANITSITASRPGRRVTLIFTGNAAGTGLTDGSNLKLGGNFVYTADDAIDLVCDGTNWYASGPGSVN